MVRIVNKTPALAVMVAASIATLLLAPIIIVTGDRFSNNNNKQKLTNLFTRAGTEDFRDLVINDGGFIDKTLLIDKYLRNKDRSMLLTRPRRFGKTINADMIRRFLEMEIDPTDQVKRSEIQDNYKLFSGGSVRTSSGELKMLEPLKISYSEFALKHRLQWPVIYVSFKNIVGNNSEWIEDSFSAYIGRLYAQYDFLRAKLTDDEDKRKFDTFRSGKASGMLLETCLDFLTVRLSGHCNRKVHLIVDDYDAPLLQLLSGLTEDERSYDYSIQLLQEAANSVDFRNVVKFMRSLFEVTLKDSNNKDGRIEKALICGTIPIEDVLLGTIGLKNFGKAFSDFYGLSVSEVDALMGQTNVDPSSKTLLEAWYGGYNNIGKVVFNTYSVPKVLQLTNRKGECYLRNLSRDKLIRNLLSIDEIQLELAQLMNASTTTTCALDDVPIKLSDIRRHDVFHLLLLFGFLTPIKTYSDTDFKGQVKIPNEEVRVFVKDCVIRWASKAFELSEERIKELGKLLLDGKEKEFQKAVEETFKAKPNKRIV